MNAQVTRSRAHLDRTTTGRRSGSIGARPLGCRIARTVGVTDKFNDLRRSNPAAQRSLKAALLCRGGTAQMRPHPPPLQSFVNKRLSLSAIPAIHAAKSRIIEALGD